MKKTLLMSSFLSRTFVRPIEGATLKLKIIRWTYVKEVKCANIGFMNKLCKVTGEFPLRGLRLPAYDDFLHQGFLMRHLDLALEQLFFATVLIEDLARGYVRLINKDDCDSMEKCKRLKVSALGCMYTVAIRCLPSLAYLDKVRQHMVKSLEDENSPAILTNNVVLAKEDYTVPDYYGFDFLNVDDFVHPETLIWLWELEQKHGLKLKDEEGDCEKLTHELKKHLALPLAA
ncbi:Nucleolar GTP-binding protein 1 [Cardamine amara subsp. amara]|uniref:Nucleolar GTP-binding protein 1 n=1 Tax=Cardamine amara subsp. amara TaxID=228776 RepID=A0ABD0YZC3_CARAN